MLELIYQPECNSMSRNILLTVIVFFIAIVGGAWSVHRVLTGFDGFNRFRIGQWVAFPNAGTSDADPYARARIAQRGEVALGQAEGLTFYIWADDKGNPLNSRCRYQLKGFLPEARFFTLYAADKDLIPQKIKTPLPYELYSQDIIRNENAEIIITISPTAEPGNWLAIGTQHDYGLVLTLYDTPIATSTGLARLVMPTVKRIKEGRCV